MYNVLLVDDDLHILNANEKYLTRQGYRISRAEDGESALKLASTAAFDAVVLDVDMPGMDGVSVCSRLLVDRASEVEHLYDACRAEIKVLAEDLNQLCI